MPEIDLPPAKLPPGPHQGRRAYSRKPPASGQAPIWDTDRKAWVPGSPAGAGDAPVGGPYITYDTDPTLTAEKTLTVTAPITKTEDGSVTIAHGGNHDDRYYTEGETGAVAIAAVEGEATLDLTGDITIAAEKSLSVDTILETTPGLGITIEGALLQHFTQLQEIATPANPDLNYLRLFARASGENIQLIALSSQGAEAVLATLDDTAGVHTNKLALNWVE